MRKLAMIPGIIFGLLFAGAGLFILNQTAIPTWQNWQSMQDWRPAQAKLLSLSGSDNNTEATYRYEFAGTDYQSDRVYVAEFKDNIGSYHADLYQRLDRYRRSGESIPIWINPRQPNQAVIDRDMRWGLFALMTAFCSIFFVIGMIVLIASIRSKTSTEAASAIPLHELRKEWKEKKQQPGFDQTFIEYCQNRYEQNQMANQDRSRQIDWKSRKGWGTAQIRSNATKGIWFFWLFAVVWNAISAPLIFAIPGEIQKNNYAVLIALLFPLVGLVLIYNAIVKTLEYRRFGKVFYEMDPYPGAIGGHVGGRIQIDRLPGQQALKANEIYVRLECIHSYVSGTGENRSRKENIKWAEQGKPEITTLGRGSSLQFRFDVPDNLPEATVQQTKAYYYWRLTLKVDIAGVDLNRNYNIPVFKTGETSRAAHHDISAQVAANRKKQSDEVQSSIARGNFDIEGLSRAMRYSSRGNEIQLSFPMFRNKFLTLIAAIFAGGFGFATYSMAATASKGGLFGIAIGVFGLPFALVALISTIATIYLIFNNLHVTINPGSVHIVRRLLFIPVFQRSLERHQISHLLIKKSGSTGQGVDRVEHYKIKLQDKKGHSATIAEDLDGKEVALQFAEYLAQRTGVKLNR